MCTQWSRVFCLVLVGASASAAQSPDSVEIPLEKIWAADMPGTRNIRELEPRTTGDRRKFGPLMTSIHRQLLQDDQRWGRPDAGSGFVVPGKDIEALNHAYDVVFDRWDGPEVVSAGEVSLIFYARYTGQFVHVESVQREGTAITIQYRFVVHREPHVTAHFALIPLGELKPGKYEVRMAQLPVRYPDDAQGPVFRPPFEGERVTRTVSQPFKFKVE
jgi:hypothetical protein